MHGRGLALKVECSPVVSQVCMSKGIETRYEEIVAQEYTGSRRTLEMQLRPHRDTERNAGYATM
jgi:hypothetical protein